MGGGAHDDMPVVVGVQKRRRRRLTQIAQTRSGLRAFSRLIERGKQQGGQNGDDRNNY